MINLIKKKLSIVIFLVFVVFSIQNLIEFNDFGMVDFDEEQELLNILEESNLDTEYMYTDDTEKIKKFELTKKESLKNQDKTLDVANLIDKQTVTDVLSLIHI